MNKHHQSVAEQKWFDVNGDEYDPYYEHLLTTFDCDSCGDEYSSQTEMFVLREPNPHLEEETLTFLLCPQCHKG
jgi:hypothetical protein